MRSVMDKLNLRPQERRWVVMAAAVLFLVLQFWLVWPHFKDWGETKAALKSATDSLEKYRSVVGHAEEYRRRLESLEGQNAGLLTQEQAGTLLIQRIGTQARESKVNYSRINVLPRAAARPNEFFEEQTLDFGINPTGDKELIDFLVTISNSDLMVRVKELNLSPDQGGFKLM